MLHIPCIGFEDIKVDSNPVDRTLIYFLAPVQKNHC